MTSLEKREYWSGVVGEFQELEISAREFCVRAGLNYQMFLRWKRKLQNLELESFSFAEILPASKMSIGCGCFEIEVEKDLDSDSLSNIIKALCMAGNKS